VALEWDGEAMENAMPSASVAAFVFPEFRNELSGDMELPAGFVSLRLILKPSDMVLELDRPDMLVGRHSAAGLRLALPDVSRRHCRFLFANGAWQVVDLDSLNGVFVNGVRVRQAELHDQDTLGIGSFYFEVDWQSGSGGSAKPQHFADARVPSQSVTHLAMKFEEQRQAS
jgi:pSer/pThr/pTyr-binding forkhead associated (FHA) protein